MLSFVLRATFIYISNAIVLLNCAGIRDFCEGGIKCFRASVRINGNLVKGEVGKFRPSCSNLDCSNLDGCDLSK